MPLVFQSNDSRGATVLCEVHSVTQIQLMTLPLLGALPTLPNVSSPPSFHNQRLEIRSVAAPMQQQIQVRVPAQLDEKNLKQLNDMNPYEFSVRSNLISF